MGRRLALTAAATAACALALATAATAAPADDARAVADAFGVALAKQDAAAACALLTEELSAKLSGDSTCVDALTTDPQEDAAGQDDQERAYLVTAYLAARGATAADPKGEFPLPARRLAREMHAQIPELTILLGTGPAAARNRGARTIVLDTRKTTKRHIVLYAESDSGTIFALSANRTGSPHVVPAGKGVPAPTPQAPVVTSAVETVDLAGTDLAYAVVRLTEGGDTSHVVLRMRLLEAGWRVDDILLSLAELAGLGDAGSGG